MLLAVACVLGACADSEPPPRSPFDDGGAVAPTTGTPRPLPTFPSTATETPMPGGPASTPEDDAAMRERVVGEAISRLAEWTGYRETSITFEGIQEQAWPSACLGVAVPDQTCAEVVTPGFEVRLLILGSPQSVHASRDGRYVWAPAFEASGRVIESVDLATSMVTLEPVSGSDEAGRVHRVVPGSYLSVPLGELEPGQRVAVGSTYETPNPSATLLVWLVVLE